MSLSRRNFSKSLVAGAACLPLMDIKAMSAPSVFKHGVASGDPLADAVIIWTRISLPDSLLGQLGKAAIWVEWAIATDEAMQDVVNSGRVRTAADRDYTVKVDADGLLPAQHYYYQFTCLGFDSPVGRSKTLPEGHTEQVRLAFSSCSNYTSGYFNAYRIIGRRDDIDLFIHLGDYIYEYGGSFTDAMGNQRIHEPQREIISLDDYRTRYALYRSDADLQYCHQRHPFICVWDDHESANNAWKGGAQNHNPKTEGDWFERRSAAIQAYFEWMPIREQGTDEFGDNYIFRDFSFGNLMDLFMIDTRLYGRDEQAELGDLATALDPNRTMLGFDQENWLYRKLLGSKLRGTRWRMLGNQVMMGHLGFKYIGFNMDQWDGYVANRIRLFRLLRKFHIDNFVVMTGDIHTSWAMDLTPNPFRPHRYDRFTGEGSIGTEFVTSSVSSGSINNERLANLAGLAATGALPHIKYSELYHRGYVVLDITHARTQAEYRFLDTVVEPNWADFSGARFEVRDGENRVRRLQIGGLEFPQLG